jgi:hypothetical protein
LVSILNYGRKPLENIPFIMNIESMQQLLGMANAVTASTADEFWLLKPAGSTKLEEIIDLLQYLQI